MRYVCEYSRLNVVTCIVAKIQPTYVCPSSFSELFSLALQYFGSTDERKQWKKWKENCNMDNTVHSSVGRESVPLFLIEMSTCVFAWLFPYKKYKHFNIFLGEKKKIWILQFISELIEFVNYWIKWDDLLALFLSSILSHERGFFQIIEIYFGLSETSHYNFIYF